MVSGYLVLMGCDSWWVGVFGLLVAWLRMLFGFVCFWSESFAVRVGLLCGGSLANLRCGLLPDVVVVPGFVDFDWWCVVL